MKKIFILFCLLPFSVLADIDPGDLSTLEGLSADIYNETITIKNEITSADNHLQYIRQMTYDLLQEIVNADLDNVLWQIRDLTNGTNTRLNQIKDLLNTDFNLVLDQLETSNGYLFLIHTDLEYIKQYQETLIDLQDETNTKLDSLVSSLFSLIDSLTKIYTDLQELKLTAQNIYTELLSQGVDIKNISSYLSSISNSLTGPTYSIKLQDFPVFSYSSHKKIDAPSTSSVGGSISSSTNLLTTLSSYYSAFMLRFVYLSNMQANQLYRMYDIQTNLYSIVSALTKENGNITNQFDQTSKGFEDQIKREYEGKENELDQYNDKITARNQSFQQNENLVAQFSALVSSFQVDSLPQFASISIVNFKMGDQSLLPSSSSIDIDVQRFDIVFRVIRGLSACFYWGIVLFLGYKITFIFVKFVRSNVLGIIPSTNKNDDGSFS